jgi:hypothetical protein
MSKFTEKAFYEVMGWEWDGFIPERVEHEFKKPAPFNPATDLASLRLTNEHAERYHDSGWKKALERFGPMGLDEKTVHDLHLGYVDWKPTMGMLAGHRLVGWTIPHYYTLAGGIQKLIGIRVRRDDGLASRDSQGEFIQPKYMGIGGGHVHGVYRTELVNSPDATYRARPVDCLFMGEDENTAAMLSTAFRQYDLPHLAAIGYTKADQWNWYLDVIVSNASKVIVLQDNEPDKIRPNGSAYNPGLDRALTVRSFIKNRPTYIIKHPAYKQLSDMAQALDTAAVIEWLAQQKECKNLF